MFSNVDDKFIQYKYSTFIKKFLILISLPLMVSCSSINGYYPIVLTKVENNSNISGRIEVDNIGKEYLNLYSDELISTSWEFKDESIIVAIENLSNNNLTLNWNYYFHVDRHNDDASSMRSSIDYVETNGVKTPLLFKPNDRIQFILSKQYFGWREDTSILPSRHSSEEDIKEYKNEYKYRKIRVNLPFTVENKYLEYLFTFDVKDFVIQEEKNN
ncbi:MAG: hypothetical protein CVV25_05935 [Ignavibacteriae bacterium HGW-Ignavibacteriae-4]|jgi:hypothetical protein|nr:MAG: hypothetical protein CVV25_05935 [Ignavibacteriae bacterium HGW-Ignavibacteriae-4]